MYTPHTPDPWPRHSASVCHACRPWRICSSLLINPSATALSDVTKMTCLPFLFLVYRKSPAGLFWRNSSTSSRVPHPPTPGFLMHPGTTAGAFLSERGTIMRHELWRRVIGLARGCLPGRWLRWAGPSLSPALCVFSCWAPRFWFIYPHSQCENGHLAALCKWNQRVIIASLLKVKSQNSHYNENSSNIRVFVD